MPGSFFGIGMASQALRGFQRALDTTGNNLANVNTEGYTRQTVEFGQNHPLPIFSSGTKFIGSGMHISSINRVRDGYLDQSFNASNGNHGKFNMLSQAVGQLERIYDEPSDQGISAALDQFFNAWSGLGSNPTDPAARAQVRFAGQNLADRIRGKYAQMSQLSEATATQLNGTVARIDDLAQTISALNKEIVFAQASGGTPNALMDQRDMALQELSGLVDVQKEVFPDGAYVIYAAGFRLVDQQTSYAFPPTFDVATGTFTDGVQTIKPKTGEVTGLLDSLREISGQMSNLDKLANELRSQINTAHRTGITGNGNTNINFFQEDISDPQSGAIDFDLSAEVKADSGDIAAGLTGAPADGGLARLFAEMRDTQQVNLGNDSFGDYFQGVVSDLGFDGAHFAAAVDTENSIMAQISEQRQAVSGVNLDEEMTNMLRFQRSYQAAAKALTIFDQVTEDLIGMLRR